jgi:hypothetical protein
MVGGNMLNGLATGLIFIGVIAMAFLWGCWELIDWLFIFDGIESETLITPEIKITVKDNVIDTLYIYKQQ